MPYPSKMNINTNAALKRITYVTIMPPVLDIRNCTAHDAMVIEKQ